ncbi:TPA: XRE family transcriptional regulator [Salmonella enterica subsp. enterica serovar Nagoya]
MKEWSDFRWMVKTMAKDSGVMLVSIARHLGISRRKLNQIMQEGPSEEQTELIAEALGCAGCDLVEIHRQMAELSEKYKEPSHD